MDRETRSVRDYIAGVSHARRRSDAETLVTMLREVTGQEPVLWRGGIIGFGACHYRYPTGNGGDSPVIGLAPRKAATTLYLLDGAPSHAEALAQLGPHSTGKGCLYVKDVAAVDSGVLRGVLAESWRRVTADEIPGMTITFAT